jgi:hypothetical protein
MERIPMSELQDKMRDIIKAPSRSKISTADIAVGFWSSTVLGEKLCDLEKLVETEKRNLIIQMIDGRSDILLCNTCADRKNSRMGGATITSWNCARCKGSQISGSTAHETLCMGCAVTYRKCRQCNYNENGIADIFEAAK